MNLGSSIKIKSLLWGKFEFRPPVWWIKTNTAEPGHLAMAWYFPRKLKWSRDTSYYWFPCLTKNGTFWWSGPMTMATFFFALTEPSVLNPTFLATIYTITLESQHATCIYKFTSRSLYFLNLRFYLETFATIYDLSHFVYGKGIRQAEICTLPKVKETSCS